MTIRVSDLTAISAVIGNVMFPAVSNIAGVLTTVRANVDVIGGYLLAETSADIGAIESNLLILQGNITTLTANAATQQGLISNLQVEVASTSSNVVTLFGQVAVLTSGLSSNVSSLTGLVSAAEANITQANVGMVGYVNNATTTANIGIIGYIDQGNTIQAAAINAANLGMKGYVDSVSTLTSYGNANVKSYLGSFDGNILPSANVTYSLGSPTNQWKDLYLSGSTIYIGGAQLSVANGAIQSSLPIAANVTATNITVQGTRIEFASGGYIEEREVLDGNLQPAGYYGVSLNSSDDGIISMNALDSNAAVTSSVFVTNVAVQLNVANSIQGGDAHIWYFDNTGGVTFPDGSTQTTATDNNVVSSILDGSAVFNDIIPAEDQTFLLGNASNSWSEIYVTTTHTTNIVLGAGGEIYDANVGGYNTTFILGPDGGSLTLAAISANSAVNNYVEVNSTHANIHIYNNNTSTSKLWKFDQTGNLVFPDTTQQITAFTATFANATPASANAAGTKGDIVYDSSYVYICVATNSWIRAARASW